VRPLLGGYYKWKDLGFPLVEVLPEEMPVNGSFTIRAEDIA
jgi:hypothetical protein